LGSFRYFRVIIRLIFLSPSKSDLPYDCWSAGATGFGTQLVLKYLFNSINGSDVIENDFKEPIIQYNEYNNILQNIIIKKHFNSLSKESNSSIVSESII
jgi:hypothetical protein